MVGTMADPPATFGAPVASGGGTGAGGAVAAAVRLGFAAA